MKETHMPPEHAGKLVAYSLNGDTGLRVLIGKV